jgi:hypothetical protein
MGSDPRIDALRQSCEAAAVEVIVEFLLTADDSKLSRINPYELAAELRVSETATVDVLLHATKCRAVGGLGDRAPLDCARVGREWAFCA